ncbi:hypothetical protein [Campylobacter sp.]|uniref:hypothetical protein n=1 Tax=Campylobacter sp. TaxID=205 RepID=UPI002703300E|nr:hypothetical protein [Campylobacter sp.]
MKFGFSSDIGEITPSIFSKLSRSSRAKIFINLYNACVENELRIPKKYAKFEEGLEKIFLRRVDDLCKFSHQSFKKSSVFCPFSNVIIHAFRNGNLSDIPVLNCIPKHSAAKLLLLLKSQNGICFDANIMFSQFVYDKIRRKHFDKNVYFQDGIIFAEREGRKIFGVLPSFKEISKDRFHLANYEIARAFKALNENGFEKMFVVFPRNVNFSKHIEVETSCGAYAHEGRLKLVPYTISRDVI